METLAYLHAALVYEIPGDSGVAAEVDNSTLLPGINWQQMSAQTTTGILAIACGLSVIGMGNNAFAASATVPNSSVVTPQSITLQRGDRGAAVADLQHRLRKAGYFDGPMTGFFGHLTEAAVVQFQTKNGLVVDGKAGIRTLTTLHQVTSVPPTNSLPQGGPASPIPTLLERGDRGASVADLQNRLRKAGYFDGPMTGFYGRLTEAAVRDFQQSKGLQVDGRAGTQTFTALLQGGNPRSTSADPTTTSSPSTTTHSTSANPAVLQRGDSGPAVAALQSALKKANYLDGQVTGFFGQLTETSVLKLQRDNGLTADGKAGAQTIAVLQRLTGESTPATDNPTPSSSPTSAESPAPEASTESPVITASPEPPATTASPRPQSTTSNTFSANALPIDKTLGRGDRGKVVANLQLQLRNTGYFDGPMTGFYGRLTEAAVREFQQDKGLTIDGKAGPQTIAALQAQILK